MRDMEQFKVHVVFYHSNLEITCFNATRNTDKCVSVPCLCCIVEAQVLRLADTIFTKSYRMSINKIHHLETLQVLDDNGRERKGTKKHQRF
jgi:hypothetical protein